MTIWQGIIPAYRKRFVAFIVSLFLAGLFAGMSIAFAISGGR